MTNVTSPVYGHEKDVQKPITWVIQHTLEKFSKVIFKLRHKDKLGGEARKGGGGQRVEGGKSS